MWIAIGIILVALALIALYFMYGSVGRLVHGATYLDIEGILWTVQSDGMTLLPDKVKSLTKIVMSEKANSFTTYPDEKVREFTQTGDDMIISQFLGIPIGLIHVRPLERLPNNAKYVLTEGNTTTWNVTQNGTGLTTNVETKIGKTLRLNLDKSTLEGTGFEKSVKMRGKNIIFADNPLLAFMFVDK